VQIAGLLLDDKVQSRFRFSTIRYSQGESGRGESTVEKRQQSRREHCRGESGDSAVKEIKLLRRERERGGSVELE
jgi:hypothetical protein